MILAKADEVIDNLSQVLAPPGGMVRFSAGTRVFEEGDPGDCAYMIDDGYVEVSATDKGVKTVLALLGPGEVVGEMSLLDGRPRSATAVALHESTMFPITRKQLRKAVDDAGPLARLIVIASINRLRSSQSHLVSFDDSIQMTESITGPGENYETVRKEAARHVRLRYELEEAITQQRLELAYQPIVHLMDGRTAGFEALIRWPRTDGTRITPDEFIPLAEDSGLIVPLGQFVLEQGIKALKMVERSSSNQQDGTQGLFVSINVSPRQLDTEANVERMASYIEQHCPNPGNLKLEITEQTLLNDPRMAAIGLARLKSTGAKIAIDDFGTGYSSLNYLHRFPLDTLKIDRSFVQKVANDPGGQRVVSAIIRLAIDLQMDVVAEGIENLAEFHWLQSKGCQFGQGYLMAKPQPLADALGHIGRSFEW